MAVKRAYGTPGGYIGREKVRKYNAVLLGYFAYCLVSAVLIWTYLPSTPVATVLWVAIALAPLLTSVARRALGEPMRPLVAGITGEASVAMQLGPLLHAGYEVVHSVDVGRASVDHIVFGPSGIYAIETKAFGGASEAARQRAVTSSATVKNRLAMCGIDAHVVPVVALARAEVPDGSVVSGSTFVVDGPSLARWIARRPVQLGTLEIERARAALVPIGA